jgi:hypothetical protein
MRHWHHLPSALIVAMVATLAASGPVGAQTDQDPCALLPTDTVAAALGPMAAEPMGDGATWCNWTGELTSLSVVIDPAGMDGLVTSWPGGEEVDLAGTRAYHLGSASDGFSQAMVITSLGGPAVMLTVASSDPDVDASTAAMALTEAALGAGSGTAPADGGSAEPTPASTFVLWCDGFTAEEVSDAVGVPVTATPNQSIAYSCGWISGPEGTQVAIELNQLDAATIADLAAGFAGVEVEELVPEPADGAWWAADYNVLHVLADDVAFHVFIGSDGLDDAAARMMAISVAAAFLAEP